MTTTLKGPEEVDCAICGAKAGEDCKADPTEKPIGHVGPLIHAARILSPARSQ